MNKPKIAITGASGFIGAALTTHLQKSGYFITGLVRSINSTVADKEKVYNLFNAPATDLLFQTDILIHCAFDKNDTAIEKGSNFTASQQLFQLAEASGVKKIIFVSSIAAQSGIRSNYGKSKLAIESLLENKSQVIVKPGLIIGNGGLFGRLLQTAVSKRFIPLIEKGGQSLQFLASKDLLTAMTTIIEKDLIGTFILANREKLTYKDFFQLIEKNYHKHFFFIPFHKKILEKIISVAGILKISLPVSKENILGLTSQQFEDSTSSLDILELTPLTLEQALLDLQKS